MNNYPGLSTTFGLMAEGPRIKKDIGWLELFKFLS